MLVCGEHKEGLIGSSTGDRARDVAGLRAIKSGALGIDLPPAQLCPGIAVAHCISWATFFGCSAAFKGCVGLCS